MQMQLTYGSMPLIPWSSRYEMPFLSYSNPKYQVFATLQPDWLPFNSLGADVVNKRKFKTGKVSDLPHMI